MQGLSLGGDEAVVGDILSQGVLEDVHWIINATPLEEKLQPLEFLEPQL